MTTKVKICGLTKAETIDAAIDAGADYIGLVFFPPSPRNVSLQEAGPLADLARGRTKIVALTVDADDSLIDGITRLVRPDIVQLHGSETPERAGVIKSRAGCSVMKVIKVETTADAELAFDYVAPAGPCDLILFDAKAPKGSVLPGGNGLTFDWRAIESVRGRLAFMLSGGLDADNVANAIRLTGAPAVDVSSGVESAPGVKDPARIRAFLTAAKAV